MRVLRMRQGDAVEVFNGKGCAVKGTIRFATDFAEVIPQEVIMQPRGLKLVLMQALVANEKMDWIIEKACRARLCGDRCFSLLLSAAKCADPAKKQ